MEGHNISGFQIFNFLHDHVSVPGTIPVHDIQHLKDMIKLVLLGRGGGDSFRLLVNLFTEPGKVVFNVLSPFLSFLTVTVNHLFDHVFVSLKLIRESGLEFFLQDIKLMLKHGMFVKVCLSMANVRYDFHDV